MSIVWLLMPAVAWGVLPLVVSKLGGKPANQIVGTTFGTLLGALIVEIAIRPSISVLNFCLAALAGAFWTIGQLGQYNGYAKIGVSKTMPLSTGLQIIGTSLVGVVIFGEWASVTAKLVGALGVILLLVGVILTSIQDKKETQTSAGSQRGTFVMVIITTIGFIVFNAIPKALSASGIAIFLPEAIGMVVAVLVYLLATKQPQILAEKASWLNIFGGLVFAVASVTYIESVGENGVNTAFVVSQISVVLSTLGGMLWLNEKKSHRELAFTLTGLVLIVAGAVITTLI